MNEIIIPAANYEYGSVYKVEKEIGGQENAIVIYEKPSGQEDWNKVRRITYPRICEGYQSPFLSWYNLIFCSNNYGPPPDYNYMHRAVQKGKKTAATVYEEPGSPKAERIRRNLPLNCGCMAYGASMLYVYHKGTLSDFFSLNDIKRIYDLGNIPFIDWNIVADYFRQPLEYFGNEDQCGFSLQSGGGKEQTIITGLLLGYPVESTINFLVKQWGQYG